MGNSLLGLLLLIAMNGGSSTEKSPQSPFDLGDSLVIGNVSGPDFLTPILSQLVDPSQYLISKIYPYLAGDHFDCRLQSVPALAKNWDWDESGKQVVFRLREDVAWEDGTPVTADDVIFTFELLRDPRIASPRANYVDKLDKSVPWKKIDANTVQFQFEESYARNLQMAHLTQPGVLPKHRLEGAERAKFRSDPYHRKPLSAGPFRVDRWIEGREIVLARNEKSTLPHPARLDRVVFRIIPNYNTCLNELLSGGIDFMYGVQPQDLERVAKNPDLVTVSRGHRFLDYVVWNCEAPLFRSASVRKALALAVDVDKMIDSFLAVGGKRFGKRATWNVSPELCDAEQTKLSPVPYSPEAAILLLEKEGWRWDEKREFLVRDGKRFEFRLMTFASSPRLVNVAQVLQSMLKKIGVSVIIEAQEVNLANENLRKKQFDAALIGWQSELWVDPSATLRTGFPFNFGSFSNARVDSLIENGMKETDPKRAQAIWKELQALILEEQPMLFLYWRDMPLVVHKRFRGIEGNILSPLYGLETWWVPKSEQKYKP